MHGHRRRKKRPSYGIRTVEVNRGLNGFGFTISGQQPCILSCIVTNSPADLAGLRAGDFLISVNGLNVSKLPHEAVVQLIGNTFGAIKMAIAENYYSDSSDEDIMFHSSQQRARPKYPHHKTKFHRTTVGKQSNIPQADLVGTCESATAIVVNDSPATAYNVIHSPNASNSCDISNVSAMVRSVQLDQENEPIAGPSQQREGQEMSLEYKAIVGYLGTIEMPKQIATSSKLQTVRSCIRKMRQEKRNPMTVLMTILPSCLNLINTSNAVIAKYSSVRLNYVSSSSENDNRYFGLVTSAIYADGLMCENSDILNQRKDVVISNSCHVFVIDSKLVEHPIHFEKAELFKIICTKDPITNLCLEFPSNSEYVVNLIRSMYNLKAPIKPDGVPYGKPPVARSLNLDQPPRTYHRGLNDPRLNPRAIDDPHDLLVSNSPQPSNHSEITTTSSNSDSGIGFHNDCRNISDRILVVDFPGIPNHQIGNVRAHFRKSVPFGGLPSRPTGIIHELPPKLDPIRNIRSTVGVDHFGLQIYHGKSKSADYSYPSSSGIDRLTVRARPDPKAFTSDRSPSKDNALNSFNDQQPLKYEPVYPEMSTLDDGWTSGKTVDELGNVVQERPIDVPKLEEVFLDLERFNTENVKNSLLAARSCDDMIMTLEKEIFDSKVPLSVDDLTLVPKKSSSPVQDDHIFLQPAKPVKRSKKACSHKNGGNSSNRQSATADDASVGSSSNRSSQLMSYKLSPKVFGLSRPISLSFENISTSTGDVRKSGKDAKDEHGGGAGGERRSRPTKRLSGGFSAIWGSLQELRSNSKQHEDSVGSGVVTSSAAEVCDKATKKQERRLSGFKILEGAYSEPDLRYDENKQINHNASPFRRWGQSSLRSRSGDQRTPGSSHRRPSSLAASESDVYTKSIDDDYSSTKSGYNPYADVASTVTTDSTQTTGGTASGYSGPPGVASWGTSFEKLLEDAAGLHTFSEFLKKEFSAENIYFWTACERYRQITECEERAKEAQAIFAKHLESGCSEPVNVDSIARNIAKEHLPQAEPTLFAAAQKQIFNLMKFDSYQRFIKSDMYKTCQDAEAKGHPLPYPGEQLDPLLRTGFVLQGTTKLKKSLSNAEDRRRKSLLPWHRKTRCKSKDRGDQEGRKESGKSSLSNGGGTGGSSNTLKVLSTNSTSDIHSSRSSLASFDAAIGKSYDQDDTRNTLCRVILSNGATTVVQTRSNETIKELVERLLDKRGIVYNAYEAFLAGNHKPLDLDGPSSSLAGKEVNIDQRVVFKLSLPNRKMISVKSKATKPLGDVLRPILLKYNYELDQMNVYSKDAYLDMTYPVTSVDGLWLQVRNGNESEFHQDLTRTIASRSERAYANQAPPLPIIATSQHQQIINHFQQQLHHQQAQSQPHSFAMPSTNGGTSNYITKKSQHMYSNQSYNNNNNNNLQLKSKEDPKDDTKQELNMLDEITNKVFNELMNGKIVNGKVPEDCTSDSSSTRRDRFRRRGSNAPSESGRGAKSKKCSTAGSEDGGESVNNAATKKPIIAKLKAGVKLQIPTRSQNDELLEGLKRAQRSRLEDQRGTEINFELPDFLKDKENFTTAGQSTTTTTATATAAAAGGPQPSKLSRKPGVRRPEFTTSSSVEFPLGSSTNGGSLQQINKPQPAPRLSITSTRGLGLGSGGSPTSPVGPVQAAFSESNLNNLSLRCNASPLMLDDNGNGSQSENSYADTTLVFTHGPANASNSPESSPSSRTAHHRGSNFHLSSGDHYDSSLPADGCSSELQEGTVTNSSGNYHPYHHHHHHHHHHHGMAHHHQQQQQQQQQHHHHLTASTSSASSSSTNSSNTGTSTSSSSSSDADNLKGPPPLPPKPKILPIKPSNWGHAPPGSNNSNAPGGSTMSTSLCNLSTSSNGNGISGNSSSSQNGVSSSNCNSSGRERRSSGQQGGSLERQSKAHQQQKQPQQSQARNVYLDHATSSFV